jgi:hypothetical protein
VPVRIIFRGLVLFKVTEGDNGSIVAKLVDAGGAVAAPGGGHDMAGMSHPTQSGGGGGGQHSPLHRHESEIQIYSRTTAGDDYSEYGKLARGTTKPGNIDITFPGIVPRPVKRADSYKDYCPKLSAVMHDLSDTHYGSPHRHDDRDVMDSFVPNTITVHGGTIRTRALVTWDAGAFPLPQEGSVGVETEVPAEVKFVGSKARGFMASECIIDVPNAEQADVDGRVAGLPKKVRDGNGQGKHSLRVPPNTVEILVTNFPPQREKALPWSAHFRWMFEAAGYLPIRLDEDEFAGFAAFAGHYDPGALREDATLLRDANGNGFPIPYLDKLNRLTPVNPAHVGPGHVGNDPWNRPLCPQGDE